jgi:hypothetical protein
LFASSATFLSTSANTNAKKREKKWYEGEKGSIEENKKTEIKGEGK